MAWAPSSENAPIAEVVDTIEAAPESVPTVTLIDRDVWDAAEAPEAETPFAVPYLEVTTERDLPLDLAPSGPFSEEDSAASEAASSLSEQDTRHESASSSRSAEPGSGSRSAEPALGSFPEDSTGHGSAGSFPEEARLGSCSTESALGSFLHESPAGSSSQDSAAPRPRPRIRLLAGVLVFALVGLWFALRPGNSSSVDEGREPLAESQRPLFTPRPGATPVAPKSELVEPPLPAASTAPASSSPASLPAGTTVVIHVRPPDAKIYRRGRRAGSTGMVVKLGALERRAVLQPVPSVPVK